MAIRSAARRLKVAVRSRRCALSQVNKLPNELLHDILKQALAYDWVLYCDHGKRRRNHLAQLQQFRAVSRHWNNVILASPQLWGTLSCADIPKKLFKLALERSGAAPLNLVCRLSNYCEAFAAAMLPLAHRWSAVDKLYGRHWHPFNKLPTSKVRHLNLNVGRLVRGTQLEPELPQLDELLSLSIVDSGNLNWGLLASRIGSRLRSLELRSVNSRPEVVWLLGFIAASPKLEQLEIQRTWFADSAVSPLPTVPAPALRSINWRYCWASHAAVDILNHIDASADASIRTSFFDYQRQTEIPQSLGLVGYMANRIQKLREDRSFEVQIHGRHADRTTFTCPKSKADEPESHFDFTLYHHSGANNFILGPAARLLAPVLRGQRLLDLSSWGEYEHSVAQPMFLQWGISLVGLSKLAIPNSSNYLQPLTAPQEGGSWLFPNLQQLRVTGGVWQPQLLDLVKIRHEKSAVETLNIITLKDIDVDEEEIDMLRELVEVLVVAE
ncbi:hypothetical protein FRB90_000302 [Tulasnella sp. 427]|nr:hypothetical protein FRB90_000302 [Tulasnella sp. 427]